MSIEKFIRFLIDIINKSSILSDGKKDYWSHYFYEPMPWRGIIRNCINFHLFRFMSDSAQSQNRNVQSKLFQGPKVNFQFTIVDDDEYAKKALLSEIDVMKSIQSPNIVQFIDTV